MTDKISMPFTGHDPESLFEAFEFLKNSPLPVETFDSFLAEYAETKSLNDAIWKARCDWDI